MKTVIKSMLSAGALSLFLVSASFAQDAESSMDAQTEDTYTQDETYTQDGTQDAMDTEGQLNQKGNKVAVETEELPIEVTDAIQDSEYAEWSIAEAYEVSDKEETMYEIHFENPEGQLEHETFKRDGEVVAK